MPSPKPQAVTFPSIDRLPRIASTAAGSASIAVLAGALVGAALVSKPLLVGALIAVVLALLAVAVAFRHPARAFVGLVLLVALIPSYAAPAVGPLLFIPAAAAAWVLAAALAWRNFLDRGYLLQPTTIDWLVGAFGLLMAISLAFSARTAPSDYVHLIFLWAGPYIAARLLLAETEKPTEVVAVSFALVAAFLAPIAIAEATGSANPFYVFDVNSTEFAVWGDQADRFGQARAEASFGHPIAFSMFLAASALLSIAMGVNSRQPSRRYAWYALAALAVGIQALALSRTGWLILALGTIMITFATVEGSARRRLGVLLTTTVVVIFAASAVMPTELEVLPGFEKRSKEVADSSDYREALLDRALEPGVLHLWGNPVNKVTPAVSGGTATDNAYIILADTWGLIPTAALVAIAIALLISVIRARSRETEGSAVLPIAALTSLFALFFVAFITQQQVMIWLLVGAASGLAAKTAACRPAPAAQLRKSGAERR
jgi:hypothetical protein